MAKSNFKSSLKFLKFLIFVAILVIVLQFQSTLTETSLTKVSFTQIVSAEGATALPLKDSAEEFAKITPGAPTLHGDKAIQQLATLVGGYRAGEKGIFGVARPIIGAIAILMIIISAMRILFADGEEGKVDAGKKGIFYGLLGLAIISLAGEITKVLSVSEEGIKAAYQDDTLICYKSLLSDPNALQCRAKLFSKTAQIGITFLKYILGAIATFEIIISAFRLTSLGGEPEKLEQDKKRLLWGGAGLAMVIFAGTAINKVFYKLNFDTYTGVDGVKPAIDASEGIAQLAGITNFVISILGPIAILMLVAGGIMYIIAGGDETKTQQAKRIIFSALIGVIVIYGAFALVSTVISGQF